MTAVAENAETSADKGATGRVARVIGPVVDVEFSVDTMPEMYNALNHANFALPGSSVVTPTSLGRISATVNTSSGTGARVAQMALRLDF